MSSSTRVIPRIVFNFLKFIGILFSFLNERKAYLRAFRKGLLDDASMPRDVARRFIKFQEEKSSIRSMLKEITGESGFEFPWFGGFKR